MPVPAVAALLGVARAAGPALARTATGPAARAGFKSSLKQNVPFVLMNSMGGGGNKNLQERQFGAGGWQSQY